MIEKDIALELQDIEEKNLLRNREDRNKGYLNFSDNDYLGLRNNKSISRAMKKSIDKFGNGSGASHLISGHFQSHSNLEQKIANILHFEDGLFYHSGFNANVSFFKNIIKGEFDVFLDKLCHASIYDGMFSTQSPFTRYPHLDYEFLEHKLKNSTKENKIIVTDSLFSMDGDIADLSRLYSLSIKYKTFLYIDDAHGFGVYGSRGLGLLESQMGVDIEKRNIIHLTTFGKSAGLSGAMICGSKKIIDYLKQKSREYIYTTASPPYLADGILKSIDLIMNGEKIRKKLNKNINLFRNLIYKKQLLMNAHGPIQPILIKDNQIVINIQKELLEKNIHIAAIRSPTVPFSESRLRISISARHSKNDIMRLADALNNSLSHVN
jgi:8-amino-7-oxononanoate synthase